MCSADGWSPTSRTNKSQKRAAVRMRLCAVASRHIVGFAALGFETDGMRPNVLFYLDDNGRVGGRCVGVCCWQRQSPTEPPARCDEDEITRSAGGPSGRGKTGLPLLPLLPTRGRHNHSRVSTLHSGWLPAVDSITGRGCPLFHFHCWPRSDPISGFFDHSSRRQCWIETQLAMMLVEDPEGYA